MRGQPKLSTKPLSNEEFKELVEARRNPLFFSKFIKVIHPKLGKVPFILYPYQISTLIEFVNKRFNIVLKFRQAGLTELISMYCLWLCMYHPHKNVVIISIKDRIAKKVLRKIKFMYKNLPEHLKIPVVNGRGNDIGTASELEFSNGSLISSIPTTEEAGRSEGVSLLVIDEAAIVRWADRIWAAAFPTLSTGGAAILNSTAYGVGNLFHKQFVNALQGGSVFNAIRLHWQMHPERDDRWYREQREILGPRRTAQEIDGDFLTSGQTVFDMTDIRDIEDLYEEEGVLATRESGLLKIFKKPVKGARYTMGMDVATGRARDYTSFSILNKLGEEVACYKGKITPSKARALGCKTCKEYGTAIFAPESNDIGLAVAEGAQDAGYPNLYYSQAILRKKNEAKPEVQKIPGWYTTRKNRPVIIAGLEEDIRNGDVTLRSPYFVAEAPTFIYDERNRPVAMGKEKTSSAGDDMMFDDEVYTDDAIFGTAIANQVRKGKSYHSSILPKG